MNLFQRIFSWGKSEAHSVLDKIEDPVKMSEQGIRDLRKDLEQAIQSLAEIKALAIRAKRESFEKKQLAKDYEQKAILLLKKAERGEISQEKADSLAQEVLSKKDSLMQQVLSLSSAQAKQEDAVAKMETQVQKLKAQVHSWENELLTLKSRAKIANSMKRLNQKVAMTDHSGTISILERMRDRVKEDEALAHSYADINDQNQSLDQEVDATLSSGTNQASISLEELKKKIANKTDNK